MTTLVKVLLGTVATVIPASTITIVTFKESLFGSLPKEISELTKRCYVIPTEKSDNQAQLLICKSQDEFNSGSHFDYYLYNQNNDKKHTRTSQIHKKQNTLEVTLEVGIPQQAVTLKIKPDNWTQITEEIDLQRACSLIIYSENNGGQKLQCTGSALQAKDIQLTKFSG